MARQDFGTKTSFEAHCAQIYVKCFTQQLSLKRTHAYLVLVGRVKWYFHHLGIPFSHLLDRTTAQFNAFQKCRLRGVSCHCSLRKENNYQSVHPSRLTTEDLIFKKKSVFISAQSQLLHNTIQEQRINNSII